MKKIKANNPFSIYENQAKSLYKLLIQHPNKWLAQEFIVTALPNHFKAVNNPNGGTDVCRDIWGAANYINQSLEYGSIVVIQKRRYKLATLDEAKKYYNKLKRDALSKLWRAGFITFKIKNDGQMNLFNLTKDSSNFIDEKTFQNSAQIAIESIMNNIQMLKR
jgi:hypothetical protein